MELLDGIDLQTVVERFGPLDPGRVVQILDYLGVDYSTANVLEDQELREGIKAYTNWPTIPQLYVKGEFVGGCDIVREMYESGELEELMKTKSVPVSA